MKTLENLKEDYIRNEKVKKLLDEGKTLKDIADQFNVSVGLPNYLKTNYEEVQKNLKDRIKYYEKVAKLYKEGFTLSQIADLEDTTKQNVSRIVKIAGVKREEGGKSKRKRDLIEKIRELNDKGYTLEYISEKLNINEMKLRQYGYKEDIEFESETVRRVEELKKKVKDMREEGFSQTDIAEKLGISQAYVSNILLEENIRTKLRKEEYIKRDGEIYNDFEEGMTIKYLVDKYNLNELNIRRILNKFMD